MALPPDWMLCGRHLLPYYWNVAVIPRLTANLTRVMQQRARRLGGRGECGDSKVAESAEARRYSRERGGSEVAESAEARKSQRSRRLKSIAESAEARRYIRERGGSEVAAIAETQK